jgi:hypothetical protein
LSEPGSYNRYTLELSLGSLLAMTGQREQDPRGFERRSRLSLKETVCLEELPWAGFSNCVAARTV